MNDFNAGDKVLLIGRWGNLLGTVRKFTGTAHQRMYTVDLLNNTSVTTVRADEMDPLPASALLLRRGTRVRVHNETPRPATCVGMVVSPAIFLDHVFGYWILCDSDEQRWYPAAVLAETGGGATR